MKIGIVFGDSNRMLPPGADERLVYNAHPNSFALFPKFYPDEIYACLSAYDIDISICRQLDAVIYYAGLPNKHFVDIMDDIPCKIFVLLVGGYVQLTRATMSDILLTKVVMDKADYILEWNQPVVSMYSLYTDTPVVMMPIPVPIEFAAKEAGLPSGYPQFDIVIPYGPFEAQSVFRNSYTTCLIGQRIIDQIDGFNSMAIFNMTLDQGIMDESNVCLREIGCRDFRLFSTIPYGDFVKILKRAKIGLDLDLVVSGGKFAVDCAILGKRGIFANTLSYARQIYKGIPSALVDPYDVDEVMKAAEAVWSDEIYRIAHQRALDFSIAKSAKILEDAVMGGTL